MGILSNFNVNMPESKIRQNYHEECEAMINKQINMEFYASYVYLSMGSYFNRQDQALHGFGKHFMGESEEERKHGIKLMEYQTKRGGEGRLPGHRQTQLYGVGESCRGHGGCSRARENGQPESPGPAQVRGLQGGRAPVRLPGGGVSRGAGGGDQGHRGLDRQDQARWRRSGSASYGQGDWKLNTPFVFLPHTLANFSIPGKIIFFPSRSSFQHFYVQ